MSLRALFDSALLVSGSTRLVLRVTSARWFACFRNLSGRGAFEPDRYSFDFERGITDGKQNWLSRAFGSGGNPESRTVIDGWRRLALAGINEHNFHGRYVASYHAFDASITRYRASRIHRRYRTQFQARCSAMARGTFLGSSTRITARRALAPRRVVRSLVPIRLAALPSARRADSLRSI